MEEEVHACIKEYTTDGNRPLYEDKFEERRKQQNPSVFAIPSLRSQAWWDIPEITNLFEESVDKIKAESSLANVHRLQHENIKKDVLNGTWDSWYLMEEGQWHNKPQLQVLFPHTLSTLNKLPIFENGVGYIYFSRLSSKTRIRSHCGPTNTKLRIQVPLKILQNKEEVSTNSDTILTVGGIPRPYELGKVLIFDDSFYHSVQVGKGVERLVLIIDIWHPDLQALPLTLRHEINALFPIANSTTTTTTIQQSEKTAPTVATIAPTVKVVDSNYKDFTSSPMKRAHDFLIPIETSIVESTTMTLLVIGEVPSLKTTFFNALLDPTNTDTTTPVAEEGSDTAQNVNYSQCKRVRCQYNDHYQFQTNVLLWSVPSSMEIKAGAVTRSYQTASGAFYLFDVHDRASFEQVKSIRIEDIRRKEWSGICLLIGIDVYEATEGIEGMKKKSRKVLYEEGLTCARQHYMMYVEWNTKKVTTPLDALSTALYYILLQQIDHYQPLMIKASRKNPLLPAITAGDTTTPAFPYSNINIPDHILSSLFFKPIRFVKDVFVLDVDEIYEKRCPPPPKYDGVPSYDILLKFLLIGDCGAGKSCFLLRLCEDTFSSNFMSTIGVDFKIRSVAAYSPLKSDLCYVVKTQIWDSAGPERFRTVTASYFRGAMGIFFCFDVYDRSSFDAVKTRWMRTAMEYTNGEQAMVLLGLKTDGQFENIVQSRAVSYEEALQLAMQYNMPYIECSNKTGEYVQDAFSTMVYYALEKVIPRHEETVREEIRRREIEEVEAAAERKRREKSQCALS